MKDEERSLILFTVVFLETGVLLAEETDPSIFLPVTGSRLEPQMGFGMAYTAATNTATEVKR